MLKPQFCATDKDDMTGMYSQINFLGNALEATEQNHRVISQNIANVNTPGYKTQRLAFAEYLESLRRDDSNSYPDRHLTVESAEGLPERVDGNNVDMEVELSQLKKNALAYQAYSQIMAAKLATMRRAISG